MDNCTLENVYLFLSQKDESFILLPGADFFLQISKKRRGSCSR